jgi:hypothetical protein
LKKTIIVVLIIIFSALYYNAQAAIVVFRTSPDNTRAVFSGLSDKQLFGLMIYGESLKNASFEGKLAVASVALERNDDYRWGIKKILLRPEWFSCFNPTDSGYPQLKKIALNYAYFLKRCRGLKECYSIAEALMNGSLNRHELIAKYHVTHYAAINIENKWIKTMTVVAVIDGHKFLV